MTTLTLTQFLAQSSALVVELGTAKLVAAPRAFSTGSFGYYAQGKLPGKAGEPMTVKLGEHGALLAAPKTFSTGSTGLYASGKVVLMLDGKPTTVQVGVTLTAIGSKDSTPAAGSDVVYQTGITATVVGSKDAPR